jgi:hypothetical protein
MGDPIGSLTEVLDGGSMGEVAAVDEPERGWFEPSWGLKLLILRCCSGLCEGPIMNYEPLDSGLDKTWKAIGSCRDAVYQDQGREDSMEPAKGVYGQQVAVQKCRLV